MQREAHLDRKHARLKHQAANQFPIADNAAFLDNVLTMSTTMKPRSFAGRLEFRLISLGMSVLAYLLEKMILRSVKSGGATARGSRIP
jgi:hypothetical protein